ncbi:MAG: hypothetical protein ACN6OP_25065 [Pseudomonadales bacterium]
MHDFDAAREDVRAAKGFEPERRSGNSTRRDGQHASPRFNALNARTRSKIEAQDAPVRILGDFGR